MAALWLAAALAGCGPSAEEVRRTEQAAERERARAARAAERAKALAEGLKALSEMPVADLRRSLDKARSAVKGSTGYAAVKDDLDSLEASYASLERIQKAAQEGKVADVLEPAIAGFQVTGAILNTRLAKSEAAIGALTDLLKRDASTAEMDRFNREMDINNALMDLAKGPYALLGGAIGLLAKSSPPEVRRRTFTALATTLPAVAFGRPALEQAIRTCHDEEDDEATRSGFATTMARLAVPLVAPSAETKPAPGAASPSPTT